MMMMSIFIPNDSLLISIASFYRIWQIILLCLYLDYNEWDETWRRYNVTF